jgi:hypothetical protein
MEWCRLYASLDGNDRVQAAESAAENSAWLLVQSMMFCTLAENGGRIPLTQVPRFGGRNTEQRTKALVSEGLWIPCERYYLLDPDIWNEEKHLSDSAERKRAADAERQRRKRARDRAAQGDSSRDMSHGSHTTESRDSRVHRRGEKSNTPPPPPGVMRPLWPAAVSEGEGEGDSSPDEIRASLAAQVREIRPEWSTSSIVRALSRPDVAERPWMVVTAAILAVARDPESQHPGRLAGDGPWWHQPGTAVVTARPSWCGSCDERTRLAEADGRAIRCPDCHPLTRQEAS